MEKKYRFDELSDKRCIKCGERLKKNLIEKKPTANMCYKCYRFDRNVNMTEPI